MAREENRGSSDHAVSDCFRVKDDQRKGPSAENAIEIPVPGESNMWFGIALARPEGTSLKSVFDRCMNLYLGNSTHQWVRYKRDSLEKQPRWSRKFKAWGASWSTLCTESTPLAYQPFGTDSKSFQSPAAGFYSHIQNSGYYHCRPKFVVVSYQISSSLCVGRCAPATSLPLLCARQTRSATSKNPSRTIATLLIPVPSVPANEIADSASVAADKTHKSPGHQLLKRYPLFRMLNWTLQSVVSS